MGYKKDLVVKNQEQINNLKKELEKFKKKKRTRFIKFK